MAVKKPSTSKSSTKQPIPLSVQLTVVVALVLLFIFVRPYISVILMSILIAFAFNPVYKYILRKTGRVTVAATGGLVTAVLTVVIPITLVLIVTIGQVSTIVDNFTSGEVSFGEADIQQAVDRGVERVNNLLSFFPGGDKVQVDKENVNEAVKDLGVSLLNGLASLIRSAGLAVFGFVSTFILSVFMIIGMWKHQETLLSFIKRLSPFDDSINNLYLDKAASMTKAMIKGQFVIAVVQGTLSAFSLWLMGLDYFWFFLTILTFLSFIPLGGGIVTIPIGIVMALTGHVAQGLFIILFHLLVVTNADNILRPKLVPKTAQLNSALLLLAVFSGIAVFGAVGVIFGPVVMIILISTLEIYARYNKGRPRPKLTAR